MPRICVIGAGASGINAIKVCREDNFDVVCYEQSNDIGGLWRYHEEDDPNQASVTKATIINSSKELSTYTDFPPPADFANYMHNTKMWEYFNLYVEHFGLREFIKFKHIVRTVKENDDYDSTGKWKVTVYDIEKDEESSSVFDGVMVCSGHHIKPLIPTFKGQEKFKGKIIHTHSYKTPDPFKDERVVVVGIGNSGGDATVEMSHTAKETYLSTRSGAWILWRVAYGGKPFDLIYLTRFLNIFFNIFPFFIMNWFCEMFVNFRFDHKLYGLRPKHRIFSQHPMVNDSLPNRILSGTVKVRGDIKELTEDGVIFENETTVTKVDSIILATGYLIEYRFLDSSILWTKDNHVKLYKYVFPPSLKHPHTLALIGNIQAFGPAVPVSEMQSRWYCQLMKGSKKLPSEKEMYRDIEKKRIEMEKRYFKGARHTIQLDWINFMDEIASLIGCKPNLFSYLNDPKLFFALLFGPSLPYQYRLKGPNSWPKARETILTYEERVVTPLKVKRDYDHEDKTQYVWVMAGIVLLSFLFVLALRPF